MHDHLEMAEHALDCALMAARISRSPLPESNAQAGKMAADLLEVLGHTTKLEQDQLIKVLTPAARRLQLDRERQARIDRSESEALDREFLARCTTAQ